MFLKADALYFDEVRFSKISFSDALFYLSQKLCLTRCREDVSPAFSPRKFMMLALTVRSVIYFSFIFAGNGSSDGSCDAQNTALQGLTR